ncbi:hypothetical protein [Mycobacteroides chelonae]|uniref:hypothetical protein n=1 Tax=Mycobacteroides chelonae TaxID=1774 RepID=UPI001E54973A|nr:hypothetical protein [Mycobacteroides chelonae]
MVALWSVVSIDDWSVAGVETQGQHEHYWYKHDGVRERTWLFKPARSDRQHSAREDVVEKLGCEIARLVGVPAARVELATLAGQPGALVEDARPHQWELQLGQVLMSEVLPDYDPSDRNHPGYNVNNIRHALARFAAPPEFDSSVRFSAFDVFAGYLLLDALLAHCDRHERNWAVIRPRSDEPQGEALCASFDHASSLGFGLSDQKREEYLTGSRGDSVAGWATRARARRFERRAGETCQTLVDLAKSAFDLCAPATREYWRARLLSVECGSVDDVVAAAPDLTDIARRFTVELVTINRGRLLDVLS